MKIKVYQYTYSDYREFESLFIDGKQKIQVGQGEPEDMMLGRDLVSCGEIAELMKEAHAAGARGETFDVEYIGRNPDDEE